MGLDIVINHAKKLAFPEENSYSKQPILIIYQVNLQQMGTMYFRL